MWRLIDRALAPPLLLAVYYKDALAQQVTAIVDGVTAARRARWEIGRHLEEMSQKGYAATPQCQQMARAQQQLEAQIEQALQRFQVEYDLPSPAEANVGSETRKLINEIMAGR